MLARLTNAAAVISGKQRHPSTANAWTSAAVDESATIVSMCRLASSAKLGEVQKRFRIGLGNEVGPL